MKLSTQRFRLPLARPFTISRGTLTAQDAIVVALTSDGVTGLGEVTANTYYGHDLDSIEASIERARPVLESESVKDPGQVWKRVVETIPEDRFAQCAIDLAVQDLFAKTQNQRCYQAWGLSAANICQSSYTIAIDSIETMVEKLNEQPNWSVYKIKLGVANDLEIVSELRKHTNAAFRVDANCGWTVDEAIQKSRRLAELGVEFIEQPLPADASDQDKSKLYRESALPLIADESCRTEEDVVACQDLFHGINVKLCKCGGLTPAVRMLKQARQLGMRTMVGCMIESSIGISANAQLLPLLDYADLDGAILLSSDPAEGVTIVDGVVQFSDDPGHGASLKSAIPDQNKWRPTGAAAETN